MSASDFNEMAQVLESVGAAQDKDEPFHIERASHDLGIAQSVLRATCEGAERAGLIFIGPGEPGTGAQLTRAGRQFLAVEGQISEDTLFFLPGVDDLWGREALIRAGTVLVDEFRGALLEERGEEYAAGLVPRAFKVAINEWLAINLFAASVALMARLSSGQAAGCLAEEIVAVELVQQAGVLLDLRQEEGGLSADETTAAKEAVRTLFDLFGDSDVLLAFEMKEPSDAALARYLPVNRLLGIADQRLEAWFHPFGTVTATGYLAESPGECVDGDSD